MTPLRAGIVLLSVCVICLVVVVLRGARVRSEARTERHVSELVELRRQAWNLHAELARLRAPDAVRRRALRMEPTLCTQFEMTQPPQGRGWVAERLP
jgi:hypothetical protein